MRATQPIWEPTADDGRRCPMIGHSGLDDHFLDVSVMRQEADKTHGNPYFRCRPERDSQEEPEAGEKLSGILEQLISQGDPALA